MASFSGITNHLPVARLVSMMPPATGSLLVIRPAPDPDQPSGREAAGLTASFSAWPTGPTLDFGGSMFGASEEVFGAPAEMFGAAAGTWLTAACSPAFWPAATWCSLPYISSSLFAMVASFLP
ncbi:hypothetical protein D3C76_1333340 [compost metagenome]